MNSEGYFVIINKAILRDADFDSSLSSARSHSLEATRVQSTELTVEAIPLEILEVMAPQSPFEELFTKDLTNARNI